MDLGLSGPLTLESGGDRGEGPVGGEDREVGGAAISGNMRPSTPAPRERGLIEEMEEEAREAGLGGWFNREDQTGLPESWSGSNSGTSSSQDQVRTTELTIIGGRTLPAPVRVPDLVVADGVLILLMEGPLRLYQCLIWANHGPPPTYDEDPIPSYYRWLSHALVQIGLSYEDIDSEYAGAVEEEGRE